MALVFLMEANTYYKPLSVCLENNFLIGEDKYPTILTEKYNMMLHWNSAYRGLRQSHVFNPESIIISLQSEDCG